MDQDNTNEPKCYIYKTKTQNEDNSYNYEFYTLDDWIKQYVDEKTKTIKYNAYHDPDSFDSIEYNQFYYDILAKYLNRREEKYSMNERYWYKEGGQSSYGISVYNNENYEGKPIFCLKSDQFGFSSPQAKGPRRIYDYYLLKSEEENKYTNVAEWIYYSRTIGGSFLWPLEDPVDNHRGNPAINGTRGRRNNQEDRVDLTLAKIRRFYDSIFDNKPVDMIFREGTNLRKWLLHFQKQEKKSGFEDYIRFFQFEDYVGDKFIPKDITSKEANCLEKGRMTTNGQHFEKMSSEELKTTLKNITKLIRGRSTTMINKKPD